MKLSMRIGLTAYLASFVLFAGLVGLILLNLLGLTHVMLNAWPLVLAAGLTVGGKLILARSSSDIGNKANG